MEVDFSSFEFFELVGELDIFIMIYLFILLVMTPSRKNGVRISGWGDQFIKPQRIVYMILMDFDIWSIFPYVDDIIGE